MRTGRFCSEAEDVLGELKHGAISQNEPDPPRDLRGLSAGGAVPAAHHEPGEQIDQLAQVGGCGGVVAGQDVAR